MERIIRTVKGILLSLLLHLLIMLLFVLTFKNVVYPPSSGKEQKISLNLSQFMPPPAPKPVVIPPKPSEQSDNPAGTRTKPIVTPPMPQSIVKKEIGSKPDVQPMKKRVLDESKKIFAEKNTEENNVTKVVKKEVKMKSRKNEDKKPLKKIVKKKAAKKVKKKRVAKKRKYKKHKHSNDPLANALMGSGTSMFSTSRPSSSSGSYGARMIKQLYGKEFNTYTPTQKKFIKNNLGTIHRITQRTLTRNGYPTVAVQTKQQGVNIVSFYLHPNGDITGLKLKKHMGYAALDQNTLEVIRIAYKDYPLPNNKTKIIFHVRYTLY